MSKTRGRTSKAIITLVVILFIAVLAALAGLFYLYNENIQTDQKLTDQKRQFDQLTREKEDLEKLLQDLEKQLSDTELQRLELSRQLEHANDAKDHIYETLLEKENEISELNQQIEKLQSNNSSYQPEPPKRPEKIIALTFDDGPSKLTGELLKELKKRDVKATFFVLGSRISSYPEALQQMTADGHEIANHTHKHDNLTEMTAEEIEKDLKYVAKLVAETSGGPAPKLIRPPGGRYNDTLKTVCKNNGWSIILWSTDTRDWESRDKEAILDIALEGKTKVKDGSIVLFHDLYESSIDASLELIDQLKEDGYTFVTVSEMLQWSGGIEPGIIYYSGTP